MIGTNTLKAKLRKGEGVVGAFNSIPSADAVGSWRCTARARTSWGWTS